jgi:hypothetical protein
MDVHVYPNGIPGNCAELEIIITDENDESVDVVGRYFFNCVVNSVVDPNLISVRVYPNPTRETFAITGGEGIATVEVYDLTGQLVKTFTHSPGARHDLTGLPPTTYWVRLLDDQARERASELLQKQ